MEDWGPIVWLGAVLVALFGCCVAYEIRYPCLRGHNYPCTIFIMVGKVLMPMPSTCYCCDERAK